MKFKTNFIKAVLFFLCPFSFGFSCNSPAVFAKYKNPYFVETGSFVGDGIALALSLGYQKVYSIELSEKYFDYSEQRFKNDRRV